MAGELRARDAMTRDVVTARPGETVVEAARKMERHRVGSVVVVSEEDDRRVIGILTESDIVRRVVARGLDPNSVRVGDVMTPAPVTVREDTPLTYVADLMRSRDIGHIPVVDEAGRLVGIIARSDIVRFAPELIEIVYVRSAGGEEQA